MGEPRAPDAPAVVRSRLRWAWWLLAWLSLILGLIGIVLPGRPTVPFVLRAAFAAARGSQRLHARLLADRRFGPMIRDWQANGAVSRRAKWTASLMMALSGVLLLLLTPLIPAVSGIAFMGCTAAWLWTRPEPH